MLVVRLALVTFASSLSFAAVHGFLGTVRVNDEPPVFIAKYFLGQSGLGLDCVV